MSHSRYPAQSKNNIHQYRPNSYRRSQSQQKNNNNSYAPNIVNPVVQRMPQQHKQQPYSNINNPQQINHRNNRYSRQVSDLKSIYPDTKWCAVYLNTKVNDSQSKSVDNMDIDVKSVIPRTNIYLNMDIEDSIILEIQMNMDAEEDESQLIVKRQTERFEAQHKEEQEKNHKIDTFMSVTSTTDRKSALFTLEENDWNLELAAAAAFTSKTSVNDAGPGFASSYNNNGGYQQPQYTQKSTIRMMLPDGRQFTYQMDAKDTFWGVYGRILQSVPELGNKAFTFELANGHVLSENEFDQNLEQVNLVPRGDIRIKY